MRPGWKLVEEICRAGGIPVEGLIGVKLDASDPREPITLVTEHLLGVVDGEVEFSKQRWVAE